MADKEKTKCKKIKLKNVAGNGSAKNKTYRMKDTGTEYVPRDNTYHLTGTGKHAYTSGTVQP